MSTEAEEADTHSTSSALLDLLKKEVHCQEEAIEIASDGSTVQTKLHDKARRNYVPLGATLISMAVLTTQAATTSATDKEPLFVPF